MQITVQTAMLILALIGGGLGVLGYFKKQYTSIEIAEIKDRLKELEIKISLYWGAIEKQTSDLLHSPHRPALDVLLDKNGSVGLTQDEAVQLVDLLQKLIDSGELSENEIAGARMLIAVTIGKYKLEI